MRQNPTHTCPPLRNPTLASFVRRARREIFCRTQEGPMDSIKAVLMRSAAAAAMLCLLCSAPAMATPFTFSTGDPDGKIATATRPETVGSKIEIESADDFVLTG